MVSRNVIPPQVGAQDPERRNSPIESEMEEPFEPVREQVGDDVPGCYFNDVQYADGAVVRSGTTYLKCERGIWVEEGEQEDDD